MIKSNILKKIATIAVTASLAIGGSLLGAAPANAVVTSSPILNLTPGGNIKTSSVSVATAATFSATGTSVNRWLVCDLAGFNFVQYYRGSTPGSDYTSNSSCKIALSGSTLADEITGTTLTLAAVTHLWDGSSAIAVGSTGLTDKLIQRYESIVSGGVVQEWAASEPSDVWASVLADPGVTGTAAPGGTVTLGAVSFTSAAISVKYALAKCSNQRLTGGVVNSLSSFTCEGFGAQGAGIEGTSPAIAIPSTGLFNEYLAIAVYVYRAPNFLQSIYLSSSLTTRYSATVPASITGTPSVSVSNGIATATLAATTGSVEGWWQLCTNSLGSASAATGFAPMESSCDNVYSTASGQMRMPISTTTLNTTAGTYYGMTGAAQTFTGKYLRYIQAIGNSPYGYAISATASVGGGGSQSAGTIQTAPGTPTIANGVATRLAGTWSNAGVNFKTFWLICDTNHAAMQSPGSATPPADCAPFTLTAQVAVQNPAWISSATFSIPATVHKSAGCTMNGCNTAPVQTSGKFLAWYERDIAPYMNATSVWAMSATVSIDGTASVVEEEELPQLDSLGRPARTQGKTPAFVKSVVKDIAASLAAIKPIHASANQPANGGVIKLETESLGTVSKILIGDTEVKTDLKDGVISFTSPLVKVPTDLTITASIGTLIFDDAIKPIATLKSVLVPVTSGNVNKITDATIEVLNSVLLADSKATNVTCTATASANNGIAKAAARAAAAAACGYLTNVAQDMVAEIVVKVDTTAARNNKATKLTFEVSK